ncbi:MAG: sulfatase-like hydrolase/transferase [Microbacteriaceae bacterium]|nr:sulfatase-like hydrolase/transferase [Microbacteriaceae bacterium]
MTSLGAPEPQRHVLWHYFLATYALGLVNTIGYFRAANCSGALSVLYTIATQLTYSLAYLAPAAVLILLSAIVTRGAPATRLLARLRLRASWLVCTTAVAAYTVTQLLIFADITVFGIFGFHLNGFVWNLVITRGGIESMGSGPSTTVSFVLICVGVLLVQIVLLMLVVRTSRLPRALARVSSKRAVVLLACAVVALALFGQLTFGISSLYGYGPVLAASDAFPLYIPTTFEGLAKSFGVKVERRPSMKVNVDSMRLLYPLRPIRREPLAHPPNIVWLVSESMRADVLDSEIMPQTWALSLKSAHFLRHYSGGNGTRMGLFSMFYGLYGNYWFPFLNERRGPVLIDQLIDLNYQMKMFTSAKFTYPEFDRTIFAQIPPEDLRESELQPPWRRDEENISLIIDFIEHRDASRPFMTFLFFESPHANYTFPEQCIIRKPYAEDMNYVSMDLAKDIDLIKNRYINACNHVDLQIGRLLDHLQSAGLMDSTVILITGDHGEEFMEKGRWGHNSEFTEEQTLTPMVLWVPGREPIEVARMTSHLDIPATIMPLLGVPQDAARDYSLGYDMLGETAREYTVISDWNDIAYVDGECKIVLPYKGYGLASLRVTTRDDAAVSDESSVRRSRQGRLVEIMKAMSLFTK